MHRGSPLALFDSVRYSAHGISFCSSLFGQRSNLVRSKRPHRPRRRLPPHPTRSSSLSRPRTSSCACNYNKRPQPSSNNSMSHRLRLSPRSSKPKWRPSSRVCPTRWRSATRPCARCDSPRRAALRSPPWRATSTWIAFANLRAA